MQSQHGRRAATLAAAAALLALCACTSTNAATSKSTEPGRTTSPAAHTATANAVSITALDEGGQMSYDISGSPDAGLVTITFANKDEVAHEMGLARVKPGVTLGQVKAGLLSNAPDAEAKARVLQVNPDLLISGPSILGPGLRESVTVPLVAGHYILTCFLPGKHGMPHVAMGMIGEFTVAPAKPGSAGPRATGTVELTDHGITAPAGFADGDTVKVENTGSTVHDFSLAKLAGKPLPAYFQCVGAALGKGTPVDECPGTLVGGVSQVRPGETTYLSITLAKGRYGYVSTQGNGADFQAGLNGTFSVS